MLTRKNGFILLIFLVTALFYNISNAKELKLADYYFIDSNDAIEPSGLSVNNGKIYLVSDSSDKKIYSLKFNGKTCTAAAEIEFELPKKKEKSKLNFEGITSDKDGKLYVIGEKSLSVVIINKKGEAKETKSFKKEAKQEEMFKKKNEGPEGICVTDSGEFIIASQNDYGKLMTANIVKNDFENIKIKKIKSREIKNGHGKEKSISDLCYYGGEVYALLKKQNVVLKLKSEDENFVEEETYTFEDSVKGSEFLYLIGNNLGEGIAIDDKYIYVVFDNNNQPRMAAMNDTRALLLKFEKP